MRVAALYDVHGMADALRAVLADVEGAGVDAVVVGGDVALGPQPGDALAQLRAAGHELHWVRGNCDRALGPDGPSAFSEPAAAPPELDWVRQRLGGEECAFLAGLPATVTLDVDGLGPTLFCHATPRNDLDVITAGTPKQILRRAVDGVEERTVVAGHTHMQLDLDVDGVRWVNAGAVGMPYEGETAAFWALLGPDVELRRSAFDVAAAIVSIRATGWPEADLFVAENLERAVSRESAIEHLERRAAEQGAR